MTCTTASAKMFLPARVCVSVSICPDQKKHCRSMLICSSELSRTKCFSFRTVVSAGPFQSSSSPVLIRSFTRRLGASWGVAAETARGCPPWCALASDSTMLAGRERQYGGISYLFPSSSYTTLRFPTGSVMFTAEVMACAVSMSSHSAAARSACQISALPLNAGAVSQNSSRLDSSCPSVIDTSLFHAGGFLHSFLLLAPTPSSPLRCTRRLAATWWAGAASCCTPPAPLPSRSSTSDLRQQLPAPIPPCPDSQASLAWPR
mmetsp:Transcript_37437/g.92101  ORF Transcript_37437/g.92101 Transcript_37437/m.92101 type:complete len:261 (+) Transcript_37437:138-920(+)